MSGRTHSVALSLAAQRDYTTRRNLPARSGNPQKFNSINYLQLVLCSVSPLCNEPGRVFFPRRQEQP